MGENGMKDLIWSKLQELFANLPDQDEESTEPQPEVAAETEPTEKAAL